jgi:hypothetical protein
MSDVLAPPRAVRVRTSDGWVDLATQGQIGVIAVYEQPTMPDTTEVGSVWITDEIPQREVSLAPPRVSSLPANPIDREQVDYVADAAAGVVWRLRYTAINDWWEFVGGSPLFVRLDVNLTVAQNAFGSETLPNLTIPLEGVYEFSIGAYISGVMVANGLRQPYANLRNVTAAITTNPALVYYVTSPTAQNVAAVQTDTGRYTVPTPNTVMGIIYHGGGASNSATWFSNRWIKATPIRVRR